MRQMFLKLDGVRGQSQAARHVGEMEITSFTWNIRNEFGPGGGGGAGKAKINDMTVIKRSDQTSPVLKIASNNGQHFKSAVLTVEEVSPSGGLLRIEIIKMTDILLGFVTSDGETDSVEINFDGLEIKAN